MSPLYRGKQQKTQVTICKRCGRRSYNTSKKTCSACGFGKTTKIRNYSWQTRLENRYRRLK